MIFMTMLTGVALIVIGVAFKIGTGTQSLTALIPAIPGVLILLCGLFAFKHKLRPHLMHAALVLSVLTIIAFAARVPSVAFAQEGKASVLAALLLSIFVCLAHVVIGVRSFIAARRQRKAEPGATQ
jgi:hypothetical protein